MEPNQVVKGQEIYKYLRAVKCAECAGSTTLQQQRQEEVLEFVHWCTHCNKEASRTLVRVNTKAKAPCK